MAGGRVVKDSPCEFPGRGSNRTWGRPGTRGSAEESAVPTCVKFVAYHGQLEELTTAIEVIADADPIDFVIQPETNRLKHLAGKTANTSIWEFLEVASRKLKNVHVIPQTQAFLNLQ